MFRTKISVKKRHVAFLTLFVLGLLLLFFPNTSDKCARQILMARAVSWYELQVPGVDTLYFRGMTSGQPLRGLTTVREKACQEQWSNAFFISCSGRIFAASDTFCITKEWTSAGFADVMRQTEDLVKTRLSYYEGLRHEMDYYDRTHTVVDDGYHIVMDYNERIRRRQAEWLSKAECLKAVANGRSYRLVRKRTHDVFGRPNAENDSLVRFSCRLLSENTAGPAVWQIRSSVLPLWASRFRVNAFSYTWFHLKGQLYKVWGCWGHQEQIWQSGVANAECIKIPLSAGRFALPLVEGSENAPVFDWAGQFVGVHHNGMLVPSYKLWWQARKNGPFGFYTWENIKAWFIRTWQMVGEVCS